MSLNLALSLAHIGATVGLLDADLYGPDIPLMVNLKQTRRLKRWKLWGAHSDVTLEPVDHLGLQLMSVGFLVAEDQPMRWSSHLLGVLVRQLLYGVRWRNLDYLIIDLPPGTGDVPEELLRNLSLAGAVLVVGPQDAAHLDARKAIGLFRDADVGVLGAVENMSSLACPSCGHEIDVFPPVPEERSIWSLGIPRLGVVPLDPAIAIAGDTGVPLPVSDPNGARAARFGEIASALIAALADGAGPLGPVGAD